MQKLASLLACAAFALSGTASATVLNYHVEAYANSTGGGTGAAAQQGPLQVYLGQSLVFNTDASQIWHGANDGNYWALTTNANGYQNGWGLNLPGTATTVGTLVASIGNATTGYTYRNVGAGTKALTAWGNGELRLWYADVNQGDNSGFVNTTVDVPEPVSLALLGIGLAGLGASRRRKGQQ